MSMGYLSSARALIDLLGLETLLEHWSVHIVHIHNRMYSVVHIYSSQYRSREWCSTLHIEDCRLDTKNYTHHTTHYTIHTTHYTLHTTHYTLHNTYYLLHTTHYTEYTTHYKLHTTNYTLHMCLLLLVVSRRTVTRCKP